ncbi:hypothetical protein [Vibrio mimicus]|uniref:hypothetical protein n=1 Tax=Vibrio mimicus TaxID=674 RepID=UPI0011D8BA30|nr:hypothetical protein [Vibrio mimicus]TXY46118.1 hypothetical protein FXE78_11210 [Vibrio mimicus]
MPTQNLSFLGIALKNIVKNNISWVFSGVGVLGISLVLGFFSSSFKTDTGTKANVEMAGKVPKVDYDLKSDNPQYLKSEVESSNYLYSVQEPLRALFLYRNAYKISSSTIDELDATIQAQLKMINELELKDNLTIVEVEQVKQLKINNSVYLETKQKLLAAVQQKQLDLAEIAKKSTF